MADTLLTVADGMVVTMDYSLRLDDGEVIDASAEGEPIQFLQGHGEIVYGLEQALYGVAVGEQRDLSVAPADGYGDVDPHAFEEVPLDAFPSDAPLELDMELQVSDTAGETYNAHIAEVRPETVLLDLNHPLASETLYFSVNVVSLRQATSEELEHGHAHGHGHSH